MHMVGHEGEGMQRALFFYERLAQPVKVGLVVFFAEEAGFAAMPALHDVQRNYQDGCVGDRAWDHLAKLM